MDSFDILEQNGITRRSFMKFCAGLAATMGLSHASAAEAVAEALTKKNRPPVIWIGAQECTGCTEALLRATDPTIENLILNTISLEYHEVLSAAAGHQVEENKHNAIEKYKGEYILVVDGSIPTKDGGVYCMVAGKPIQEHIIEAAENAASIIALGSCSAWGGVPSIGVNPTGASSLQDILPDKTIINIPGCPPHPHNFLATVVYMLTNNKLPELDSASRPEFAYGKTIHAQCERLVHFESGQFAKEYGDEGHRKGYCLYMLGCKGPETYGNCPTLEFCGVADDAGIWPVGVGVPCIGCNEKGVVFDKAISKRAKFLR